MKLIHALTVKLCVAPGTSSEPVTGGTAVGADKDRSEIPSPSPSAPPKVVSAAVAPGAPADPEPPEPPWA